MKKKHKEIMISVTRKKMARLTGLIILIHNHNYGSIGLDYRE